jgi:hypothetical protein
MFDLQILQRFYINDMFMRYQGDIVVGINLHLLSLTTGLPHPQARTPLISVNYDGRVGRLGVRADISQDLLGFMAHLEFFEGISELWVWNWKCGTLYLVSHCLVSVGCLFD